MMDMQLRAVPRYQYNKAPESWPECMPECIHSRHSKATDTPASNAVPRSQLGTPGLSFSPEGPEVVSGSDGPAVVKHQFWRNCRLPKSDRKCRSLLLIPLIVRGHSTESCQCTMDNYIDCQFVTVVALVETAIACACV